MSKSSLRHSQGVFTAGGTRHCLRRWSDLTSDPFILKSIMGVTLDSDTLPHQTFVPKPLQFSKVETDATDVEIADFWTRELLKTHITPSQNLSRMSLLGINVMVHVESF